MKKMKFILYDYLIILFFPFVLAILFSVNIFISIETKRFQPFINEYTQRHSLLGDEAIIASGLPDPVKVFVVSPFVPSNSQVESTRKFAWSTINLRLSSTVRAGSPEEVNVIVLFTETNAQAGSYNDGQPAYQKKIDVVIIDARNNAVLGRNSFLGGAPPTSKAGSAPGYGSSPKGKAVRWLNSFLIENLVHN